MDIAVVKEEDDEAGNDDDENENDNDSNDNDDGNDNVNDGDRFKAFEPASGIIIHSYTHFYTPGVSMLSAPCCLRKLS